VIVDDFLVRPNIAHHLYVCHGMVSLSSVAIKFTRSIPGQSHH
jgi:hypothetical protein